MNKGSPILTAFTIIFQSKMNFVIPTSTFILKLFVFNSLEIRVNNQYNFYSNNVSLFAQNTGQYMAWQTFVIRVTQNFDTDAISFFIDTTKWSSNTAYIAPITTNTFILNSLITTGSYKIDYSFIKLYSVSLSDAMILQLAVNGGTIDLKNSKIVVYK